MGYVVIEQFTDKVLNKERRKIVGRFMLLYLEMR